MKIKEFSKKQKAVMLILIMILLLLLFVAGFVFSKLNKLGNNNVVVDETIVEESVAEEEEEEEIILVTDEEAESLGEAEVILPEVDVKSDKDVFNILLLGTDERTKPFSTTSRADSIMILSLDKGNNTMKLVSLQRGMGFPILEGQYKGEYDWLTHLFRYGGADLMLRSIRECLNVDVEYYVRVNTYTFQELVNVVGGVDIEMTEAEVEAFNRISEYNKQLQRVQVGMNHLDGYTALTYSRLRSTDSDWKRVQRQRNVLESIASSAKEMTLLELNGLLDTMLPLVQTNLTTLDILGLLSYAPAVLGMEMEQMTIPVKGTYGSMKGLGGRNLYAVDFQENSKILHEFLYGVEAEENQEASSAAESSAAADIKVN